MRKSHSEHFSTAVPQKADVVLNSANGSFVPTTAVSGCNNGCTRRASYSITSSARASSVELISPPASSLSRDEYIAGTGVAP